MHIGCYIGCLYTMFIDQRARISLARAMYEQADVYLLDDPLSPLPTYTRKKIFKDCIVDHLKDKTRVLVTRDITELYHCDEILLFNKDGKYDGCYCYEDFKKCLLEKKENSSLQDRMVLDNVTSCEHANNANVILSQYLSDSSSKTVVDYVVDVVKKVKVEQYIRQSQKVPKVEENEYKAFVLERGVLHDRSPPGT